MREATAAALRATKPEIREHASKRIRDTYVNRARVIAQSPEFKKFQRETLDVAATWLAQRGNKNHERRQAAQQRTVPNGAPAPVPKSLIPKDVAEMHGNIFSVEEAMRQASRFIR